MNPSTFSTLSLAFDYMLRASQLGTAAIAVVLFIRWTLRRRLAPGARSWLWLPVAVLCVSPQLPGLVDWGFTAETLPQPVKEQEVIAVERDPVVVVRGEPQPLSGVPDAKPVVPALHFSLKEQMAMGWAAGSLAMLLFWLAAYAGLWRRIRRQQEPAGADLLAEYQACAHLSGFKRAPRLMVSAAVESPAVAGLWWPVVLMPPHLATSLEPEALRHVLLHELAHLKRKDLWLHWASALVVALHWFNPFVWLASRKFRGDCEAACDATVIRLGENRAHAYGQTLLALESRVTQPVALRLMAGVLGGADMVRQRIVDIAHLGKTSGRAGWLAFLATLGGAAVIALAAAEPVAPQVAPAKPAVTKQTDPSSALFTRTFKVRSDFLTWTQSPEGTVSQENAAKLTALEVLKGLGVHFPEGASAAFISSSSLLIVRNTQANLDFVEAIVEGMLSYSGKQVYIRSHLVVFKEGTTLPSLFAGAAVTPEKPSPELLPKKTPAKNEVPGPLIVQHPIAPPEMPMSIAGVFTDAQFQFLLKSMMGNTPPPAKDTDVPFPLTKEVSSKVEAVVGLPSVTTRSGSKAALEVVREFVYVTAYDKEDAAKQGEPPRYVPKSFETRPIGLRLEIEPVIGSDGYTVDLNLSPQMPAFTGWVDMPMADGAKIRNPTFHSNAVNTAVTIWDGQTLAFGGQAYVSAFLLNPALKGEEALASKKYPVMIFVSAMMVDPSGHPVNKKEALKVEKVKTPDVVPASAPPASSPKKADATNGRATSRAVVQLGSKEAQFKEPHENFVEGFTQSQIEILKSEMLRKRAEKRLKTYHPELSAAPVTLGFSRAAGDTRVQIEVSGSSEPYVRHYLDCLLDELLAYRKEAREKSLAGTIDRVIAEVLENEKEVEMLAGEYERAVAQKEPKEKLDRITASLERARQDHRVWKQKLDELSITNIPYVKAAEVLILERPTPPEGNPAK